MASTTQDADAELEDVLPEDEVDRAGEIASRSAALPEPEYLDRAEPLTLRLAPRVYHEFRYSLTADGDPSEAADAHVDALIAAAADADPEATVETEEAREVTVTVSPQTRRAFTDAVRDRRVDGGDLSPAEHHHSALVAAALSDWDAVF